MKNWLGIFLLSMFILPVAFGFSWGNKVPNFNIQKDLGINPTCGEKSISVSDLDEIAQKSNNQQDFLDSIPKDSMQSFTFVTSSQSLHRGSGEGMVSDLWPRVLRFSTDGKIVISYVCHPKNHTYGSIETIFFNDEKGEFETVSYDFRETQTNDPIKPEKIKYNQSSCKGCHTYQNQINGKLSLKPNMSQYRIWGDCKKGQGVTLYGAQDDFMMDGAFENYRPIGLDGVNPNNCNSDDDLKFYSDRKSRYEQFKELQKNNPCFSSLPWGREIPKVPNKKYRKLSQSEKIDLHYFTYPYRNRTDEANTGYVLDVRPNLRLTKTLSLLNARRVFHLLKNSKNYNAIKYALGLEVSGCEIDKNVYQFLSEKIGEIKQGNRGLPETEDYEDKINGDFINWKPRDLFPITASYAQYLGFKPGDWTLLFNGEKNDQFEAAVDLNGNQAYIHDVVAGLLYDDIVIKNGISNKLLYWGSTDKYFHGDYQCIDKINPELYYPRLYKERVRFGDHNTCRLLEDKLIQNLGSFITKSYSDNKSFHKIEVDKEVDIYSVDRGKDLVNDLTKGKCISCHSPDFKNPKMHLPQNLMFMPMEGGANNSSALSLLRTKNKTGAFYMKVHEKLENREMPLGSANDLTEEDRVDILNYIESLIKPL